MRILTVGGNGTLGRKVSDHFSKKHTVTNGYVISVQGEETGEVIRMYANC